MSVHKSGAGWKVRWREGGTNRQRTFARKGDADKWDRMKKDESDRGGLPADPRRMTFEQLFWDKFFPNHVAMLEDNTQAMWRRRWFIADSSVEKGVKPKPHYLGRKWARFLLAEITFDAIKQWHGEMKVAGCTAQQMFSAHDGLIAVLSYARSANIIAHNPAAQIKRPRYKPPKVTDPWLPDRIEAVRFVLLDKAANGRQQYRWQRARDAAFVSVLAYLGLRTWDEGATLEWGQIGQRTVEVRDTKTHEERSVPLPTWVKEDLLDWKARSGLRTGLVFPRSPEESLPVTAPGWRTGLWAPVLETALGEGAYRKPYHLRHSCISMWIEAGHSVTRVAEWAGHRPQETLDTYTHVFEGRDEANPLDIEATVRGVRAEFAQGTPHLRVADAF